MCTIEPPAPIETENQSRKQSLTNMTENEYKKGRGFKALGLSNNKEH